MSIQQHRQNAEKGPVQVTIVVVSSTRTESTDRSGKRIEELLVEKGHDVRSRTVVDDDEIAIRNVVWRLSGEDVPVVILTGGTGIAGRDVTPEALAPLLDPRLDGFGELFRWLSFQEIGSAAMMSRAVAGMCGRTVVFALPGSQKACELAVERLILPEIEHLVHLARTDRARAAAPTLPPVSETPAPPPLQSSQPAGTVVDVPFEAVATGGAGAKVGVGAMPSEAAPAQLVEEVGWLRTVKLWGAQIQRDAREPLPEEIERLAPVMEILHRAGEFATLVTSGGRRWALFGYPDLVRPSSKVLAVRTGGPLAHVLAVHRWPVETGTCSDDDLGPTPSRSQATESAAERLVGRKPEAGAGPLFAVSGDALWFERGRKIARWDGRRETDQGTPNQALATLVLEWSQR